MKVDRTKFLLLTGALSAATAVGAATQSGCTTTSATTDGGTTRATDSGTDSTTEGGDGGACLGDTVTEGGDAGPLDCSKSTCPTDCTNVQNAYKPGVAQAAVQCILALPTCESGSAALTSCATDALDNACDDATADALCTKLVAGCTSGGGDAGDAGGDASTSDAGTSSTMFDQKSCVNLVRSLASDARTNFVTCVTEGAGADSGVCKTDPGTCIDSFLP